MSTVETTILNEIIIDTRRLNRKPLCIYQDDAMECYDKII